ncbi:hypothetical protein GCM10007390_21000 [Persicitalea jodogahamensis]|uniref:HTH luxR-type domain-containing protein n=2 Tax=Persicitalea jodogahamensis TaxID=402147 RepID=A0A8J3D876_9BACT|nr:hypothetical protein GCM10007390_21000 [Persicitalea jodogahamensis]
MFCLGLMAGGVLVLFRQKEYGQYLPMRYLRYYLILTYTFGFYALWSRLLLRELYFPILPPASRLPLSRFLTLLSVPFLLAGMLMLILWIAHILKPGRRNLMLSILITSLVAALVGYFGAESTWTVNHIYAAFVLVLMTGVGTSLALGQAKDLNFRPKLTLAGLAFVVGVVHLLLFVQSGSYLPFELLFIFLYFLSHTVFAVYYVYRAKLPDAAPSRAATFATKVPSLELFVENYDITPRELEVIQEIYRGKTNKEIAETLFVTVQTIKDHTHRIYQKTEVKSRTQLISLMRTFRV